MYKWYEIVVLPLKRFTLNGIYLTEWLLKSNLENLSLSVFLLKVMNTFCFTDLFLVCLFDKLSRNRSSRPGVFCKKGVLRNFTKFTVKHLCQSLFFENTFSKNTFFHRTPLVAASIGILVFIQNHKQSDINLYEGS